MSLAELGRATHYSPAQLSRVETGRRRGGPELAKACDEALGMGGELAAALNERSGEAVPMQLPPPTTGFVGRGEWLGTLNELRDTAPPAGSTIVVTAINGMAGIGKTALAVYWAHTSRAHFPDGILFADLRGHDRQPPLDANEVLDGFLRALGVQPASIAPPGAQRTAQFRTLLQDSAMLVVLDNAATAEQVRPLLAGVEGCMTIITSRNRLAGLSVREGARTVSLDQLSPGEALELLRWTIDARTGTRVDAEPAAALRLAESCGFLPLALRIAADHVLSRPQDSLAAVADELARVEDRLGALSVPDDEVTAVRAVFSWSYDNLSPRLARAFRCLALQPGRWISTAAAAAVLSTSVDDAQATLHDLAAAHLLQEMGSGRYGYHDLLRIYAAERAAQDERPQERERARRRLMSWYLHTAAAAAHVLAPSRRPVALPSPVDITPQVFGSYDDALEWCEAERAGLMTIIRQTSRCGERGYSAQLTQVLWAFFYLRRHLYDWLDATQLGVDAARASGDQEFIAHVLDHRGTALAESGRVEQAIRARWEALVAFRRIGDRYGESVQLSNVGDSLMAAGRHEEALPYFHQAIAHSLEDAADGSPDWGTGITVANLGESYLRLGRFEEAAAQLERALVHLRATDTGWVTAGTLTHLGEVEDALGRHEDAIRNLNEALELHRAVKNQWGEANTLTVLGTTLIRTGCTTSAHAVWTQALSIYDEIDDPKSATKIRTLLSTPPTP